MKNLSLNFSQMLCLKNTWHLTVLSKIQNTKGTTKVSAVPRKKKRKTNDHNSQLMLVQFFFPLERKIALSVSTQVLNKAPLVIFVNSDIQTCRLEFRTEIIKTTWDFLKPNCMAVTHLPEIHGEQFTTTKKQSHQGQFCRSLLVK